MLGISCMFLLFCFERGNLLLWESESFWRNIIYGLGNSDYVSMYVLCDSCVIVVVILFDRFVIFICY